MNSAPTFHVTFALADVKLLHAADTAPDSASHSDTPSGAGSHSSRLRSRYPGPPSAALPPTAPSSLSASSYSSSGRSASSTRSMARSRAVMRERGGGGRASPAPASALAPPPAACRTGPSPSPEMKHSMSSSLPSPGAPHGARDGAEYRLSRLAWTAAPAARDRDGMAAVRAADQEAMSATASRGQQPQLWASRYEPAGT
eukprot:143023-Chlamydomonas_euryale.AAC.1